MITLSHVSKTFHTGRQSFKALQDINLQVDKGDIIGIIGSSGAGKSTLMRCINLLERPDQGQVIVNGLDITRLKTQDLARQRRKIGMIFQHFNLLSSRNVFGNIAFPLELERMPRQEIRRKVETLLQLVGLTDKGKAYPGSLSGGEKQRVAIARALANDPYVLLCDEATSALDPVTTRSILQLLREINQQTQITILLITHEMEVARSICKYIAVIEEGRLSAKGTFEALLHNTENSLVRKFASDYQHKNAPSLAIRDEWTDGLYPVLEISLGGSVSFELLIGIINDNDKAPYRILKAEICSFGSGNSGFLLLHLLGSGNSNEQIFYHFNQHKVHYSIKGYV